MLTRPLRTMALATLMACASTPTAGVHRDPNLITAAEIANSNESNAYDVVSRLRPMFLKSRGRTTINGPDYEYATVFVNGQRYGELSTLKMIVANQVDEIRYMGTGDAVSRYGMQYGTGVIDVKLK
jgi:hypothetical protein